MLRHCVACSPEQRTCACFFPQKMGKHSRKSRKRSRERSRERDYESAKENQGYKSVKHSRMRSQENSGERSRASPNEFSRSTSTSRLEEKLDKLLGLLVKPNTGIESTINKSIQERAGQHAVNPNLSPGDVAGTIVPDATSPHLDDEASGDPTIRVSDEHAEVSIFGMRFLWTTNPYREYGRVQ